MFICVIWISVNLENDGKNLQDCCIVGWIFLHWLFNVKAPTWVVLIPNGLTFPWWAKTPRACGGLAERSLSHSWRCSSCVVARLADPLRGHSTAWLGGSVYGAAFVSVFLSTDVRFQHRFPLAWCHFTLKPTWHDLCLLALVIWKQGVAASYIYIYSTYNIEHKAHIFYNIYIFKYFT